MTAKETFAKQLGARLAQVRKAQGVTQSELAKALELSQAVIAQYEAGRKNIPVWRMINMSEALGVMPQALLDSPDSNSVKRGPAPKLLKQVEKISNLPRREQQQIIEVMEALVDKKTAV